MTLKFHRLIIPQHFRITTPFINISFKIEHPTLNPFTNRIKIKLIRATGFARILVMQPHTVVKTIQDSAIYIGLINLKIHWHIIRIQMNQKMQFFVVTHVCFCCAYI